MNLQLTQISNGPQSHMTASRRALVAFLARYPLCYGYWKKFADLERRAGYTNKAQEVWWWWWWWGVCLAHGCVSCYVVCWLTFIIDKNGTFFSLTVCNGFSSITFTCNVVLFQVCVQGLKAIPLSVDLWIHYINLLLGTLNMNLPESSQRIRRYTLLYS